DNRPVGSWSPACITEVKGRLEQLPRQEPAGLSVVPFPNESAAALVHQPDRGNQLPDPVCQERGTGLETVPGLNQAGQCIAGETKRQSDQKRSHDVSRIVPILRS